MRIALFMPDFRGGGAQHMMINTANELAKRGHTIDLLVVNADGPHIEKVAPAVNIVNFDKGRTLAALMSLSKYLGLQKPDILLSAMTHSNILAIIARILKPGSATRIVVTERTFLSAHVKATTSRRDKWFASGVRLFYPFADKVIGISAGVANDICKLARLKETKVGYIYNPVVTPQFKESYNAPGRQSLKDTPDQSLIITSGRLSFEKDYATLLNGFAILRRNRNAKLVFLGDGPLKSDLTEQARELGIDKDVMFAGFVPDSLSYMKVADIFVMTSLFEGFCNVIVEALYCGLPVVSTDAPSGPREILEQGRFGKLVPVGNAEQLAKAMEEELSSPHQPEKQRQRSMFFTVEEICDQYETLFKELTKAT